MLAVLTSWVFVGMLEPPAQPPLTQGGERHLLALLALVALTFPLGFVWALVLNLVAYLLALSGQPFPLPDTWLAFAIWLGFFVLGYVQWFKLTPSLMRRWRARHASAE